MKRIAVPAAVILILGAAALGGCGSGSGNTGTVPMNSVPQGNLTTPVESTLNVYLVKGETVTRVTRKAQSQSDLVQQALAFMLAGPTEAEKAEGLDTAIPQGTRLLSYAVADGKAVADFSKEMLNFGGGSSRVQAILGQITDTIKSNDPAVTSVAVTVEGKPAEEAIQP